MKFCLVTIACLAFQNAVAFQLSTSRPFAARSQSLLSSTATPSAATDFDVMEYITDRLPDIEKALDESIVSTEKETEKIVEAMKYSLMAGGKRIRPVLCLAACEMFNNGDYAPAMPAAVSLEMVSSLKPI